MTEPPRTYSDELELLEEQRRAEDIRLADEWRRHSTRESLVEVLARANELNAVSPHLRVRFQHSYESAAIRYDPLADALSIGWEHLDGDEVFGLRWGRDTSLGQFFTRFREAVRSAGDEYAATWVDIDHFVADSAAALVLAITSRNGTPRVRAIGPLIESFPPQWVLTEIGLECVGSSPYVIHALRTQESDWREHMRGKPWVDQDSFDDSFDALERVYTRHPERFPDDAATPKRAARTKDLQSADGEKDEAGFALGDPQVGETKPGDVFIIHGHDLGSAETVARLVEKTTNCRAVILHEQPNGGRTIIEKLEDEADQIAFAVALLTPDDAGLPTGEGTPRPRARQNVVYEWGYFSGTLGRSRTAAVVWPGIELPSDVSGVVYIAWDAAGAWKTKVLQELRHAGIDIDLNEV